MKYPKEYLDEIKLRLKVSQVVGKIVQLKKRGTEFVGLSPFKNEKSPSFTVSDEKEFYHCFSTGEHGNIFDFLMKTQSIGFGEAVKSLAVEAGMQPHRFSNYDEKKEKIFKIYKEIFKEYSKFFCAELFNKKNIEALNYLNNRGLNQKNIEEFNLGYVPWENSFYQNLKKNFSEEEINSTGLYYKHDKIGKFIDRFNSRIIFPVNNLAGDTIAFGGRIIKNGKLAKYINSPETEYYKKGRMLFNLDKAKSMRSETNEVIVVEGYMDVVSLYSSGIKNVISNSGTALTEQQINLVWKFYSNPILCLDGDQSGQNASMRIAEKLLPLINENNKIFFLNLPNDEDPDDYIKKNGKEKFLELINKKIIIQSYIWNFYLRKIDKNDPFAISKFEKEIKKICISIQDQTLRKYILEDYLLKIKELTPIQNTNKKFVPYQQYKKNYDAKILNETKNIHKKNDKFSKKQLKEFSILFIILNYQSVGFKKIKELSNLIFSEKNEKLKIKILNYLSEGIEDQKLTNKVNVEFEALITDINNNSNIKMILQEKKDEEILEIFDELLNEIKDIENQKKIDTLESKLMNNLDENSYSELISLKNQLNRD